MRFRGKRARTAVFVVGTALLIAGCGDDLPTPVSPTPIAQPPVNPTSSDQAPINPISIDQPPVSPISIDRAPVSPTSTGQEPINPIFVGQPPVSPISVGQPPVGPISIDQPPVSPLSIDQPAEQGVTLKVKTAPDPIGPKDEEIVDRQPLLVASNATGLVPVTFGYDFEVHRGPAAGSPPVDSGRGEPHPHRPNSTSYRMQASLALGTNYSWRVRATYPDPVAGEDAVGAWSDPVPFSTAPVVFTGPPQLVEPTGSRTVSTRPGFRVTNAPVEGDVQRLVLQVRLAPAGTELTDTHIAVRTETTASAGEEVQLDLRDDYSMVPGETYHWQARAVAHAGSRTFRSEWSPSEFFEAEDQSLRAPVPVPLEGPVSTRPTLTVRHGDDDVVGRVGDVFIRIEVAVDRNSDREPDDPNFTKAIQGRAPMQVGSRRTRIQLEQLLDPETSYVWRARAVAPDAPFGRLDSDWSDPAPFVTGKTVGDYPLGPVSDPPRNLRHIVQRVADDNPRILRAACEGRVVDTPRTPDDPRYEFLSLAVEALRQHDNSGRWGTSFWIHPPHPDNLSRDRVAYYLGDGNPLTGRILPETNPPRKDFRVIEILLWRNCSIVWWDSTEHLIKDYPKAIGHWRHPPPRHTERR